MAQAISNEALEKGTGKSWGEWLKFFESIHASELTHKEIALTVYEKGGVSGWWAQMVTVSYEQHIGRRIAGQDCTGEFAVSVNKTLDGTMDSIMKKWQALIGERNDFSNIPISRGPDVSQTEKWRYWRCGLSDGSVVNVNIHQKSPAKAGLSVQHEKLESNEQAEHWRAFWKEELQQI